jgi:hypothetical protein
VNSLTYINKFDCSAVDYAFTSKLHKINNIINFKIVVEIISPHMPLVLELDTIVDETNNNTNVIQSQK